MTITLAVALALVFVGVFGFLQFYNHYIDGTLYGEHLFCDVIVSRRLLR